MERSCGRQLWVATRVKNEVSFDGAQRRLRTFERPSTSTARCASTTHTHTHTHTSCRGARGDSGDETLWEVGPLLTNQYWKSNRQKLQQGNDWSETIVNFVYRVGFLLLQNDNLTSHILSITNIIIIIGYYYIGYDKGL